MSTDAFKASRLLRDRHPRSSVSRAYYAAYAAVTHRLTKVKNITLDYGDNNPAHGSIVNYIQRGFVFLGYTQQDIDVIVSSVNNLYRDRLIADYQPGEPVDEVRANRCVRWAEKVLVDLGLLL